jgi:exosortase
LNCAKANEITVYKSFPDRALWPWDFTKLAPIWNLTCLVYPAGRRVGGVCNLMDSSIQAFGWPSIRVQQASRWIAEHWRLILMCLVVLALFGPVVTALIWQWSYDSNYSHGWLVPVFSGYLIWRKKQNLPRLSRRPSWFGFFVVLGSLALLSIGQLGAELFLTRISLLGTIVGIILFFRGWPTLRALAFPLSFLLFMVPLPALVFNQLVFPLQLLASRLATACLEGINVVPVLREGNLLILPNYTLQVVEACSGIRSLISLMALGLGFGYLAERSSWIRIALLMAMVPVAIVSNGVRVMATALLVHYKGVALAEGFYHSFSGWVIFLVAVTMLLGWHTALISLRRRFQPESK